MFIKIILILIIGWILSAKGGKFFDKFLPKGAVPETATRGVMDLFSNKNKK